MIRKLPVIPTLVVLAAVAVMVRLGFWQLDRLAEKEALLAEYQDARDNNESVIFPSASDGERVLFRRSSWPCMEPITIQPVAGRNATGQSGWVHRANCPDGSSETGVSVDIGWSRTPQPVEWHGDLVEGIIAPGPRLVVTEPQAGLEPVARPDPTDIPNNHLAYAVQWFFFAFTALVIYLLALRRKQREQP